MASLARSPVFTVMRAVQSTLTAFPIACFTLALGADIAYWQTSNLLWLHFSEWLLFAGLVFGGLAVLVYLIFCLVARMRPAGLALVLAVAALGVAFFNNLVHSADGWTAVVPWGLTLSAATLVLMVLAAIFNPSVVRHD